MTCPRRAAAARPGLRIVAGRGHSGSTLAAGGTHSRAGDAGRQPDSPKRGSRRRHRPAVGGRHRPRGRGGARHQRPRPDPQIRHRSQGGSVMSSTMPDSRGRFGEFGGRFVPETVMGALDELTAGYETARADPTFAADIERLARDYVGRPSPLYEAERFAEGAGARILLKREDLNHTGAHKINNARRPGAAGGAPGKAPGRGRDRSGPARRRRGHRVCAVRAGMPRVHGRGGHPPAGPNVVRMGMLGAEVVPVTAGSGTLKDAMNEAHSRLDLQRGDHPLSDRLGGRPSPLSDARARPPGGDRSRGAGADAGAGRASAGLRGGMRRRRLERDRHVSPVHR